MMSIIFSIPSEGQITKGNWMVGGDASFRSMTLHSGSARKTRTNYLNLSPDIGYFIADKFALGLAPGYESQRSKILERNYNLTKNVFYRIGPSLRYYFLPADNQFNILVEGRYQFEIERGGGVSSDRSEPVEIPITQYTVNTLSIAAGPLGYLNFSVGRELPIGYLSTNMCIIRGETVLSDLISVCRFI